LTGQKGPANQNGVPDGDWYGAMLDGDDILLNSKEVAQILDCSPDTVNELARKSALPAFKKGRQWRFRKRDIASFKRQLRGTTAA
jgi:excisionase family DNA binding protein